MKILLVLFVLLAAGCATNPAPQAQVPPGSSTSNAPFEDAEVYLRMVTRTPEQLTAFYQGRGFPQAAIDAILDTCFITPIIKNKSLDTLWLDLEEWRFFDDHGKPIPRLARDYWPPVWDRVDLPQAHRSTFGWTLMPEVRDLRLDESVGGSVVLPLHSATVQVEARFPTGPDRTGPVKLIRLEGVPCHPTLR